MYCHILLIKLYCLNVNKSHICWQFFTKKMHLISLMSITYFHQYYHFCSYQMDCFNSSCSDYQKYPVRSFQNPHSSPHSSQCLTHQNLLYSPSLPLHSFYAYYGLHSHFSAFVSQRNSRNLEMIKHQLHQLLFIILYLHSLLFPLLLQRIC